MSEQIEFTDFDPDPDWVLNFDNEDTKRDFRLHHLVCDGTITGSAMNADLAQIMIDNNKTNHVCSVE